jgi:hypothetical protein
MGDGVAQVMVGVVLLAAGALLEPPPQPAARERQNRDAALAARQIETFTFAVMALLDQRAEFAQAFLEKRFCCFQLLIILPT